MMKKINIICTFAILLIIAICSLAIYKSSEQPKYYSNGYATLQPLSLYDPDDIGRDTTTTVKKEHKEYVLGIFEDLAQMYGVEKRNPNIGYFHPHDRIESQQSKDYIYINFMDYDNIVDAKAAIAHELIHYLSTNGRFSGFLYILDDTLIFGHSFTEGVTNYFSTQYAPDPSYYQYETHVAKLVSICYGEEALANDFFASDVSYLRNDFNSALKKYYSNEHYNSLTITPFDLMTLFLNTYGQSADGELRAKQMLVVDEMLLYYAKQKGCESEVKEEISDFATTNNLDFLIQLL